MSYLDDLSYRTIIDGYDNSLPVRKSLKFVGATIQDDELNDRTIVSTSEQLFTITLSEVLSNGNSAGNSKITNLGNPVFSADAVNKAYVDNIGLDDVLAVSNVATSDINMSDYKITSLATPVDGYDAVNKNYVDEQISLKDHGTLAGLADDDHTQYLLVNGTRAMSGELNMNSYNITNVATPVDGYDAVNKNYVDDAIGDGPVGTFGSWGAEHYAVGATGGYIQIMSPSPDGYATTCEEATRLATSYKLLVYLPRQCIVTGALFAFNDPLSGNVVFKVWNLDNELLSKTIAPGDTQGTVDGLNIPLAAGTSLYITNDSDDYSFNWYARAYLNLIWIS